MAWDGIDRRTEPFDNTRDLVIQTHERVENLCSTLLGNGKPGAIALLTTAVDELDGRIQTLEGWRKWVNGVGATLGAIFAMVATFWHYIVVVKVGKGE